MFSLIKEITYKVSSYCNLDCVYCFQSKGAKELNNIFKDFDALSCFMGRLPFENSLEIKLTGGEVSLFIDDMRYGIKQLKKLERKQDIKMNFTVITNGVNMQGIIDLMEEGLLEPNGTKFSWDGVYSASKSRKPKNPQITDGHFNNQIKLVGKSKYNNSVLVRTAVTPDTIDNLYESLLYLLESGCRKWEYYFLTDCEAYKNPEFQTRFKNQITLIAQEYIKRYQYRQERWVYSNWDSLYFVGKLNKNNPNKQRAISCRHLGRSLYIAYDGYIFPCGHFDPYSNDGFLENAGNAPYVLGNIYEGFDEKSVEKFVNDYMVTPACDYTSCNNLHCFECPALNKMKTGQLNAKNCQTCVLRSIERQIFDASKQYIPLTPEEEKVFANRYNFIKDWDFQEIKSNNYHNLFFKEPV